MSAPEQQWVQLLPTGPAIKGRDGREWRCANPQALVDAFRANKGPLAIDWEHAIDLTAGQATPAAGWIEDMQVRGAGELWGLVDWTPRAREAIATREYRFLSPVFAHTSAGDITAMMGAGLVHRPNLELQALNARQVAEQTILYDLANHRLFDFAGLQAHVGYRVQTASTNSQESFPMIIKPETMEILFTAYNGLFKKGLAGAKSFWKDVAMFTTSKTGSESYAWLGQFPQLREWVGDRVLNNLSLSGFTLKNQDFESTVELHRNAIEDDQYGALGPIIERMGQSVATHPDKLIFSLMKNGFNNPCFDGQSFFDTDHPVGMPGFEVPVSNMQAGSGEPWFLLDTSQSIRPFIWQEREKYVFQQITGPTNERVIMHNKFVYGVHGRGAAGYGLWQLAFGSKAELSADNYADARARMQVLKGDQGDILGINPNVLVVSPTLEKAARKLLFATSGTETVTLPGGALQVVPMDNVWHKSADMIVTPFLV